MTPPTTPATAKAPNQLDRSFQSEIIEGASNNIEATALATNALLNLTSNTFANVFILFFNYVIIIEPVREVTSNLPIDALTISERIFCYMLKHGFNRRDQQGGIKRRFYSRWQNMKTRCFNPQRKDWPSYGGRGITVSTEWLDFDTFRKDMYPSFLKHFEKYGIKDTTLDRIDTNRNYSKENCKWATKSEQGRTMRRVKTFVFRGKPYSIRELVKLYNRPYMTIYSRLERGIPLDQPYRSKPTNNR